MKAQVRERLLKDFLAAAREAIRGDSHFCQACGHDHVPRSTSDHKLAPQWDTCIAACPPHPCKPDQFGRLKQVVKRAEALLA